MISTRYIERNNSCFGNSIWDIEISDDSSYEEMLNSKEMYILHHVLEWKYTRKELEEMGRYKKCPANELIWVKRSTHNGNKILHKDFFKYNTNETYKENLKNRMKGNTHGTGNKGRKCTSNTLTKMSEAQKKRSRQNRLLSEFGKKYFEHFGYGWKENPSQYCKEKYFHKIHNKFSWEV